MGVDLPIVPTAAAVDQLAVPYIAGVDKTQVTHMNIGDTRLNEVLPTANFVN